MLPSLSCRYSQQRRTPSTAPSTCQLASSYQAPSNYQAVKVLTSSPGSHKHTPAPGHTTHGQEKIPNSIMIVIIIIISIKWIYIFILLFFITSYFLLLIHEKKVFIVCSSLFNLVWCSWWYCWVWFSFGLGLSAILTHLIWHIR